MNQSESNAGAILQKKGFAPSNFRQGLFEDHTGMSAAVTDDQMMNQGLLHSGHYSIGSKRSGQRKVEIDPQI